MSTTFRTYVLWGVILPFDGEMKWGTVAPYLDDKTVNARHNITVLFDGRDGQYIAVGHVIARTEEYGGFEKPVTIPNGGFPMGHEADLSEALAELGIDRQRHAAGWHIISHYR